MTMGPLPMTRIECRSSRRGTSAPPRHQVGEVGEEVRGVVWSGPGLGMVLHAERGDATHAQTLDGAVVQVHVRDLGTTGDGVGLHHVVVVLAGDLDASALLVTHRVVRA